MTPIVILGFVASREGMTVDPDKIKSIVDWAEPTSIHVIRRFHGLANILQVVHLGI